MESVPVVLKEVASISDNAVAIVCGPPIIAEFTKPVIDEPGVQPENVPLSLDMKMKYGIGKCGRCNTGDKFVCRDGPVFTYKELQSMPKE